MDTKRTRGEEIINRRSKQGERASVVSLVGQSKIMRRSVQERIINSTES
jgi:hypothetical protein